MMVARRRSWSLFRTPDRGSDGRKHIKNCKGIVCPPMHRSHVEGVNKEWVVGELMFTGVAWSRGCEAEERRKGADYR